MTVRLCVTSNESVVEVQFLNVRKISGDWSGLCYLMSELLQVAEISTPDRSVVLIRNNYCVYSAMKCFIILFCVYF